MLLVLYSVVVAGYALALLTFARRASEETLRRDRRINLHHVHRRRFPGRAARRPRRLRDAAGVRRLARGARRSARRVPACSDRPGPLGAGPSPTQRAVDAR